MQIVAFLKDSVIKKIKKENISEKIILFGVRAVAGGILLFCPLFFLPIGVSFFVPTKTLFFIFCSEILVFFYLLLILLYPKYRPQRNLVLYLFLLYVLILILSGIVGVNPAHSFWAGSFRADGVILLIHTFAFFVVVSNTSRSEKVIKTFLSLSILASLVMALSVYVAPIVSSHFNIAPGELNGGLAGNDSYTGVYLLFNIFFIILLFFWTKRRSNKFLLIIAFLFISFSPIFFNQDIFKGIVSFSNIIQDPMLLIGRARGAFIANAVGIFCALLLMGVVNKRKIVSLFSKTVLIIGGITLAISIALTIVPGTTVNNWLMSKTGGYRNVYWHQAIEGFKDRPILGWGPGAFRTVNVKYYNPDIYTTGSYAGGEFYSDKAHNIIYDTLVSTGLLGLISYLGLFVSSILVLWKSKKISRANKSVFSGLFLAYFLQNLVFFDVFLSYLMFSFSLALIVFLSSLDKENQTEKPKINAGKYKLIFILPIIAITLLSVRYFAVMPLFRINLEGKLYSLPPEIRASLHNNKPEISHFGNDEDMEMYATSIYGQYLNNLDLIKKRTKNLPLYLSDLDGIINSLTKESKSGAESVFWVRSIYKLYDIRYQLAKDDPVSLNGLRKYGLKEVILAPNDLISYLDYAHVFVYEGDYHKAIEVLERAYLFSPKNIVLNTLIINLARETGDKRLVQEKIERMKVNMSGVKFE